jgi:mRNA-degrading endonuclease toxin of MazEF toxin-antitoxin module
MKTSSVKIVVGTSLLVAEGHVPLRRGEGGLPEASMAKCEQVTTLHKSDVEAEEIGALSPARMREIEHALLSAVAIDDPL